MDNKIYDFAAVGAGPFNIGLACLTAPIEGLEGIFLDKRSGFNWHPGMLLQDTTLQVPFLADLVTLADPTSPFSFLNYLKEQGRIYSFYIRENFKLLRNEYNYYCQWAIQKLPNIHFNTRVDDIRYDEAAGYFSVHSTDTITGTTTRIKARKIVLGTGTVPNMPACCKDYLGKAIHSSAYLHNKKELQAKDAITIVGSGQSAAEIYYDLLQDIDTHGYALHWITRSPRFYPLEYSKLTLEMTSPEYVDYFYSLPQAKRDHLIHQQKHLYKGINNELISAIFDLLYAKRLQHDIRVSLRTNAALQEVSYQAATDRFRLVFFQEEQEQHYEHTTNGLVLATGYTYRIPEFLQGIREYIDLDEQGRFKVSRYYTIDKTADKIFVQNAELHTHGFVTPDLGMGCYRNAWIIKALTGKEIYPIEQRIAFQQFATSGEELIVSPAPAQL
ncbi:lysine N(6)-hydroxylase/L-ornithine N(5)-oxygenase family protein [Chitinophaga nivalis]|uniref:SidA/IucD/PvdA family monooxygenase n=1 Tax=Chitinophaga nivalis TaxID=2991709 RepID=A0ABT3IQV6_9BACT|nr:SidA/IucD/PvdA family monooxygenase [Chitinophaga nivalis]MCW3464211.1 SidA/IucD/PvdA family monooxygenase [Chitinophaga nivalis]MCW3486099.1 SidA/IucD/PvdA family monooxygenase [Chitinophaga nivalis]